MLPLFQEPRSLGVGVEYDFEKLVRYVKDVRKKRQLTLLQIEERGGPSRSWTSMLERGQMFDRPKFATLERLAGALGVPLSDLLAIVGYQAQEVESASSQEHGNHDRAMVLRVVASDDSGQNHGREPIIGENLYAAEGMQRPDGQLKYVGDVVAVPILGAAACGEPIAAIMDTATEHLYLPLAFADGANAAIRVRGNSMSGAGIVDGDFVLVKLADGIKPASGKPVVVRTPDGYACKFFREDDLGVYLEEHVAGQEVRRVKYDEAELVGLVIRQVRDWA